MRVDEAVGYMSKAFLHRVIDSFTRDLHKPDEEESRQLIIRNLKELADSHHIVAKLQRSHSFDEQVLMKMVLRELLIAHDHRLTEGDMIERVQRQARDIIEQGGNEEAFKYKDATKVETYRTVLEVALQDERISPDELKLLTRLRNHLGLREQDHSLIQASLGKFPTREGRPHSPSQVTSCLTDLQKRGVVFFCNRAEKEPFYVIPEEIIPAVKQALGIELSRAAFALLLDRLSQEQLKKVLEEFRLPTSGKKEVQVTRILDHGHKPSEALSVLGLNDLGELCKALPGVKSSGSKSEKIENLIDHFDKLRTVEIEPGADPRELFFQYYVELAHRDRENLLTNKVISKDKDMDNAFEEATRYLFEQKLGREHVHMPGSEHADGVLAFGTDALLMWDTKSKESVYAFPNSHLNQFKRYIRDSDRRVSCFLVIGPTIAEQAVENALRLKAESGTDTDVALIAAEDLKWLADEWRTYAKRSERFDLQVMNYTGILDRQILKQRMRLFLE